MRAERNNAISKMVKMLIVFTLGISLVYLTVGAQEDQGRVPNAPKAKSEALAFRLSCYSNLVFYVLSSFVPYAWVGMAIGPALGYFYAGLTERGTLGVALRGLAIAAILGGGAMGWNLMTGQSSVAGELLIDGGLILFVGSALWDIFSVKKSVREHNQRLQQKKLSFAPFYIPTSKTIGFQVQFCF